VTKSTSLIFEALALSQNLIVFNVKGFNPTTLKFYH